MGVIGDPDFWHRFSVALHLHEREGPKSEVLSDEWLRSQQQKRRRVKMWIIAMLVVATALFVGGVVAWKVVLK